MKVAGSNPAGPTPQFHDFLRWQSWEERMQGKHCCQQEGLGQITEATTVLASCMYNCSQTVQTLHSPDYLFDSPNFLRNPEHQNHLKNLCFWFFFPLRRKHPGLNVVALTGPVQPPTSHLTSCSSHYCTTCQGDPQNATITNTVFYGQRMTVGYSTGHRCRRPQIFIYFSTNDSPGTALCVSGHQPSGGG